MDRILYCIGLEHDWRWTLVAGLICVLGVGTAVHLLTQARSLSGPRRRNLILLAVFVGGLAAFTTHFLAMQGYQAGGEIRYRVWLTLASFAAVMASNGLACALVMIRPSRLNRTVAAVLALAGVAVMHFVGMAALQMAGEISWRPELVAVAIVGGLSLAGLTGGLAYGPGPVRLVATGVGGALSIIVLHFVAMSAMDVSPNVMVDVGTTVSSVVMTGVLVAMVAGIAVIATVVAWMDWASRAGALSQIREAIDAMPDGLAFYDADDRLVLSRRPSGLGRQTK